VAPEASVPGHPGRSAAAAGGEVIRRDRGDDGRDGREDEEFELPAL
jgi:hypothetical protein